jgi:hypothetical protein
LTEAQIKKSLTSGGLSRVKDKVFVRKIPPTTTKSYKSVVEMEENLEQPSNAKSIIEYKEFDYEELHITDDEYALQNSDTAEEDDLGRFRKE